MNYPQAGTLVVKEMLEMANAAVAGHLELKKSRQGMP
jgi:hypothetical protein